MTSLKYFTLEEFDCQHTGDNRMELDFLKLLDELRDRCGFPFRITSGYRSPIHPVEATKRTPGTHSQGIAADISISNSQQRHTVVKEAIKMGFSGIGVSSSFVHVDTRAGQPLMWTYN